VVWWWKYSFGKVTQHSGLRVVWPLISVETTKVYTKFTIIAHGKVTHFPLTGARNIIYYSNIMAFKRSSVSWYFLNVKLHIIKYIIYIVGKVTKFHFYFLSILPGKLLILLLWWRTMCSALIEERILHYGRQYLWSSRWGGCGQRWCCNNKLNDFTV